MNSTDTTLWSGISVGDDADQPKGIGAMTVEELRRTDPILTEQSAKPCQQDFQLPRFGRLGNEQSLLSGLWTCWLCLHVQTDHGCLRWMHLQIKLDQFQQRVMVVLRKCWPNHATMFFARCTIQYKPCFHASDAQRAF